LQKFRPSHETMASIGNQVRLRRTPLLERRRPFLRTLQVENLATRFEDAAIDAAGVQRRHFPCRDRHHGFVEQCDTSRNFTLPDQRTALTLKPESGKIFVAEMLAAGCGLHELLMRGDRIAGMKRTVALQQQVSSFYGVGLSVDEPSCARKPAARLGEFSIDEQREPQPKCTTRSALDISAAEESLVRAR
jgi:hypothetical protein